MAIADILFGLWQTLTLDVQSVGDELDEETRERMKQREEMLHREMTRLWQEVEEQFRQQKIREQSGFAWASRLLSALQHWQFWAVAGFLVLLFGLCWWLRKWSREPEREEESSDNDMEEYEENDDEDPIQWPDQNRDGDCDTVKNLVKKLIALFNYEFFYTWYPVLEKAIEVDSAFEGWIPREKDIPYRLLVPLKPPHGHIFHLEQGFGWPERNFRIRVDLVCTCEMGQPAGETCCFLHDPEEEERRNEGPSILHDLCTDSYLDVQKIAHCFQKMVRHLWKFLPDSAAHRLIVLPTDRSCKFRVTQGWEKSLLIELIFAVQQGDSDIYLSSQHTKAAYTPSTMWPESYTAAETKFFKHIARHAEPDSVHLRCLKLCAHSVQGREFSNYVLKTAVMHLLTTIPLSDWGRIDFLERLEDILQYLQTCLEERRLNHFFIGNENVPEEITVPLYLRVADPLNLFHHLEQDLDAHEDAWFEFLMLQHGLRRLVLRRR